MPRATPYEAALLGSSSLTPVAVTPITWTLAASFFGQTNANQVSGTLATGAVEGDVVVVISAIGSANRVVSSIDDGVSTAYTNRTGQLFNNGATLEIWSRQLTTGQVLTAGVSTINVTWNAATSRIVQIFILKGMQTNPFQAASTAVTAFSSGTTITGNSLTPTIANTILISAINIQGGQSDGAGTPDPAWDTAQVTNRSGTHRLQTQLRIVSSTAAVANGTDLATARVFIQDMVAFKGLVAA